MSHAGHWRLPVAIALSIATLVGVGLLRTFDPNSTASIFPPCLFRVLTGLYCPGCGLTRMLHALVHGDLAHAASMNLLMLAALPTVGVMAANEFAGRRLLAPAVGRVLYDARLWIGTLLVFGVLRNLPWMPFAALAPG